MVAGKTSALEYINVSFIFPASNFVEGLFSQSGYANHDRLQILLSSHLEAQMFLNVIDFGVLEYINLLSEKNEKIYKQ